MACASALLSLASCDSDSSTDPSSQTAGTWNKKDYGIPWNTSINYGTFTDARDGQVYRTVTIGKQTWMAENLNYQVDSSWWYNGSADSGAKFGRLYTWAAAMKLPSSCNSTSCASQVQSKHQGVCPSGWHLPSKDKWDTLETYLDTSTAGTKLKSTNGWLYSGNGTDTYGFRALPAGLRSYDGSFGYLGNDARFWSSSESDADDAWYSYLYSGSDELSRADRDKKHGFSVRCLKDDPSK